MLDRVAGRVRAAGGRPGHDLGVAVNLSARSLHDADLVAEVARLLRRHGVPADRLTLEVTEGSVMADPARAVAVLHQLRELGVRLSVDDFGTGYSSLSYLQRLPVQEVKIDRSFVTGAERQDARTSPSCGPSSTSAAHLGLEVVAEGVEDQPTLGPARRDGLRPRAGLAPRPGRCRPTPLPAWLEQPEQERTGRDRRCALV